MSILSCGILCTTIVLHTFAVFAEHEMNISSVQFWCFVGGDTPVLIPNTAVKPS